MYNIIQAFIDSPAGSYDDIIIIISGCLTIVFTCVMIDLIRDVFRRFIR